MQIEIDGKDVFVATGGREHISGAPGFVFIHGAAFDHTVWALQARYFAWHGWNVVALDLPGHGKSAGPALVSIREMADWTGRVLDVLGVNQAVFAGHSMGSMIALDFAGRHPDRVLGLALCGTALPMRVAEPLLNAAQANDHAALDMVNVWGTGREAQLGHHRWPGLWHLGTGIRQLERAAPGVLHNDLAACNDYGEGLEMAANVTAPARLVLGRADLMTPVKATQSLMEALADADRVILEHAGHSMMTEDPDGTLDALIGLAARIEANRAA